MKVVIERRSTRLERMSSPLSLELTEKPLRSLLHARREAHWSRTGAPVPHEVGSCACILSSSEGVAEPSATTGMSGASI